MIHYRLISAAGFPNFSQQEEKYINDYEQGIALVAKSAREMSSLKAGEWIGCETLTRWYGKV